MRLILSSLLFVFIFSIHCSAKTSSGSKPEWVSKGESSLNNKRTNQSYYFKAVSSEGSNLQSLRDNKANTLSAAIGQQNKIQGNVKTEIEEDLVNTNNSKETIRMTFSNDIKADVFYARLVDEYWEYVRYPGGESGYKYYALYAVSYSGQKPNFDEFSTTTSYGSTPIVMSIIPGLGQWYKGSKVKGVCMFAAEAAAVAGILICANKANDAEKKIKLEPKFAKHYEDKKSSWETGRNICIGAAAAIWIYNMIDAAVAKGTRRVEVKPAGRSYVSLAPALDKDYAGFSLSYNF